jgi:alkanesulfonate monooxygenase SsuD/methylene tetrahydromethanopterin reductase-like flavin-dependent oxidoreductase (luciferase family)
MRLGLLLGVGRDWRASLEQVRIAEDLGYEHLASGEAWGPSILPWLTLVAAHTTRMTFGTAILNCFSRTPAVMAQEFSMLDQISGGRVMLGLGSSGQFVIEHFHGVKFDRPLQRMRETVEIFNKLIAGEKLNHAGEIFQLKRGFQLDYARPRNKIPVAIAAITPKSIEQTGEIADGVIPIHWAKQRFPALRQQLNDAAKHVGRDASFTIMPFTNVTVLDGNEDEKKWRAARQQIAFYVNRMGVFYWRMLARSGYEAEVSASRKAFAEKRHDEAISAISDRMVRDLQVIGGIEEVRAQLRERAALGADLQLIYAPHAEGREFAQQLEALVR